MILYYRFEELCYLNTHKEYFSMGKQTRYVNRFLVIEKIFYFIKYRGRKNTSEKSYLCQFQNQLRVWL